MPEPYRNVPITQTRLGVALSAALSMSTEGYIVCHLLNLGEQQSSGVDLAWDWAVGSSWTFDLIGTYFLKKEVTLIPNEPSARFDCAGLISQNCFPTPEWRHLASATYDSDSFWSVGARWRYYGSVDYEGDVDLLAADEMKAYNYIDLNATFHLMGPHRLIVGVNNVFDEEPPLVGATLSWNANTIAGFYDTLGRFLFANLMLSW